MYYCCCTVVLLNSGTSGTRTFCTAVPDIHTAVVTHTPRPCDVTGRQKRVSSNPRLCFFVFLLYSCTVYCCAIVHTWWVDCWWVGGAIAAQLYCYCTVLLLLSPAAARSLGRSHRRSCAATVARASIAGVVDRPPSPDRSPATARPPPLMLLLREDFSVCVQAGQLSS